MYSFYKVQIAAFLCLLINGAIASRRLAHFKQMKDQKINNAKLILTHETQGAISCAVKCSDELMCNSFNLEKMRGGLNYDVCQLFGISRQQFSDVITDTKYSFYYDTLEFPETHPTVAPAKATKQTTEAEVPSTTATTDRKSSSPLAQTTATSQQSVQSTTAELSTSGNPTANGHTSAACETSTTVAAEKSVTPTGNSSSAGCDLCNGFQKIQKKDCSDDSPFKEFFDFTTEEECAQEACKDSYASPVTIETQPVGTNIFCLIYVACTSRTVNHQVGGPTANPKIVVYNRTVY